MTAAAPWPAAVRAAPLAPAEIVRYLIERGLLNAAELVDDGIEVVEASRGHLVHLLTIAGTRGFAVKQVRQGNPGGNRDLERERAVYALGRERPELGAVMPALYDDEPGLLVLELVQPGDTLLARAHATGPNPGLAFALGTAIAAWHGDTRELQGGALPLEVPWVLTLFEPGRSEFVWHHPAMAQTLGSLSADGRLEAALRKAREDWRPECLVHGDLKWDNCLLEDGRPGQALRVIDWELACVGDPGWDLAGGLADALLFEGDAATAAAAALWAAYAAALEPAEPLLERSISFAGARLVQTCLEYANQEGAGSPGIAPIGETAMRLLDEPAAVAEALLGRSAT